MKDNRCMFPVSSNTNLPIDSCDDSATAIHSHDGTVLEVIMSHTKLIDSKHQQHESQEHSLPQVVRVVRTHHTDHQSAKGSENIIHYSYPTWTSSRLK